MSDTRGFWNRHADRYIAAPVKDQAAYERKLFLTRAWFTPETEVLEFAAGSGATALSHAPYVRRVHAIDYSEKMVASACQRAEAAKSANVRFDVAAIEDMSEVRAFDAVLGLSILHLVDDRAKVLAKVFRLLRPGGVFVSSTACLGRWSPLRPVIATLAPLGIVPRVGFFSIGEFQADLRAAGFTIKTHWQPKPNAAHFIIAQKPGNDAKLRFPET